MPPTSRTAAIFVNFHSERLIVPRASRLAAEGMAVVVTDNSGTFPTRGDVQLMTPGENLGFGTACNRAVAACPDDVDIFCLHNPDVDIEPTAIHGLANAVRAQTRPGAAAPVETVDGIPRPLGYAYPKPLREVALATRAVRRKAVPTRPPRTILRRSTTQAIGERFPGGGLLVVSRAAHNDVGGFDEQYFLYGEDLDYWHRLKLAARDVEFRRDFVMCHEMSTGSPMGGPERELLRWLGVELFAEKFLPDWVPFRRAHRLFLPFIARWAQELGGRIGDAWRSALVPSAVLHDLRPFLANRHRVVSGCDQA